jgi:hypothetical protein
MLQSLLSRGRLTKIRRTLKRSGYDQKSPLKGLIISPLSGLPSFFHSCQVSTGSDINRNGAVQTVSKV